MTKTRPSAADVIAILRSDAERWRLLGLVAQLDLPDCWIGAGFVRSAIWDSLHDRPPQPVTGDVDVIWFFPEMADETTDREIEDRLQRRDPSIDWSVKNQARMHLRNGDQPYGSACDAMTQWPETATAIAARRIGIERCEIACPYGLEDVFNLIVRPAGRFRAEKRPVFEERLRTKRWLDRWPDLVAVDD